MTLTTQYPSHPYAEARHLETFEHCGEHACYCEECIWCRYAQKTELARLTRKGTR